MSFAMWGLIVSLILFPISLFLVSDTAFNIRAWYQMKYSDTRYIRILSHDSKVRDSYVEKIRFDEEGNPYLRPTDNSFKLKVLGKHVGIFPRGEKICIGDNGRLFTSYIGHNRQTQEKDLNTSYWRPYIPFEVVEEKPIVKKYPKYEEEV